MTWYIYNLLAHLPEADRGIHYTAFLSEKDYGGSPGLKLQRSRLPTDRPAVRIAWEQLIQPSAARRAGLDLIHGLAFVGPMGSGCPFTVTVHDLSFLFYPQGFRALNRLYLRLFARLSARRARPTSRPCHTGDRASWPGIQADPPRSRTRFPWEQGSR